MITSRLERRVALVTGAGQGIGRAIAARFLDEGASVVIVEVDRDTGEDARAELSARGRVLLEIADVAEAQSHLHARTHVRAEQVFTIDGGMTRKMIYAE